VLFATQIVGGVGQAIGLTVGVLLVADMAGVGASGLTQSAAVVGAALLAVPTTWVMRRSGRRRGLVGAYLVAALGAAAVVIAAGTGWIPLLFVGFFLFGGATTAGLQARYTAVDLAPAPRRGRHLSLVVWATTVGAVAGPNLAPLAGTALAGTGWGDFRLPTLAGPFVFSVLGFAVAALLTAALLRPDPLLTARAAAAGPVEPGLAVEPGPAVAGAARAEGMRAGLAAVLASPAARLGAAAMAVGHLVMVGVMAMTPVHIGAAHPPADTLRIVGVVLSLHIAGMFAFAPVTGWLTDRFGRRPVILGGVVLLLAACAVAGTAGHDSVRLSVGLFLLGLGWSATLVAGSTLLSESVPAAVRPSAQGLSDMTMGLAGAAAGAISGLVMQWSGYATLSLLAAIAIVPLAALAARPGTVRAG
jgi:MFS family permease